MNKNGANYYQIDETKNTINERCACHKINEHNKNLPWHMIENIALKNLKPQNGQITTLSMIFLKYKINL